MSTQRNTHRSARTAHFSLRLTPADREALDRVAVRDDVPASWLARQAIRHEIERRESAPQEAAEQSEGCGD